MTGGASAPGELGLGDLELEWEPCEMRRGMAWQLALSHSRQKLREEAAGRLQEDSGPASTSPGGGGGDGSDSAPGSARNVHLEVRVHRRSSRCVTYLLCSGLRSGLRSW